LGVRLQSYKRLHIDDLWVCFAFAALLASNILWHYQLHKVYMFYAVLGGKLLPTGQVINTVFSLLRILVAFNVLFVCCLWGVKFSFLAFFKKLGQGSQDKHYWWWFVGFITVGTGAAHIGDYNWGCSTGSTWHILSKHPACWHQNTTLHFTDYCTSPEAHTSQQLAFRINTAFDLLTDVLSAL
jgi:hypothetical protein